MPYAALIVALLFLGCCGSKTQIPWGDWYPVAYSKDSTKVVQVTYSEREYYCRALFRNDIERKLKLTAPWIDMIVLEDTIRDPKYKIVSKERMHGQ